MSKFRSGVPRSGSAPLRRQRATPIERIRKESKSQEHVHDDSDSDGSGTSDSETSPAQQTAQSPLAKVDMTEPPADMAEQDDMIDPSLLAMSHEAIQGALDDLDTAGMDIEDVQDYVEEHVADAEAVEMEHSALQSDGRKRKHEEDENAHGNKRTRQDEGQQQIDEYTNAGNALGSSQTSESGDMGVDTSAFDSPSAITLASEADKNGFLAEQPTETEEEKRIRREEKRKRKEERRARKEAKLLEQAQFEAVLPSGINEEA